MYAIANASGLISNYHAVDMHRLREARGGCNPPSERLAFQARTYHVQFTTMDVNGVLHPGLKSAWNCASDGKGNFSAEHNGEPTPAHLKSWASHHEQRACSAGYPLLVESAQLVRNDTGEIVCKLTF